MPSPAFELPEVYRGKLDNALICSPKNLKVKPLRHRGFAFLKQPDGAAVALFSIFEISLQLAEGTVQGLLHYLRSGNTDLQCRCDVPALTSCAEKSLGSSPISARRRLST